jgi:DNA-nicking Smr family endonuclease
VAKKRSGGGLNTPFERLAEIARRAPPAPVRAPSPAPAAAPPKPRPRVRERDDDDARAFEEAMRGAAPLPEAERRRLRVSTTEPAPPARSPPPRRAPARDAEDDAALADLVSTGARFEIETVGETVAGRAAGIDARVLRRLRAGEYPVDATLDLHGRAREEATRALERSVQAARAAGHRCLLVIHGRGNHSDAEGPVLRPVVWDWLGGARASRAAVMAFASAPAGLGGAGATLVLLRKGERPRR